MLETQFLGATKYGTKFVYEIRAIGTNKFCSGIYIYIWAPFATFVYLKAPI